MLLIHHLQARRCKSSFVFYFNISKFYKMSSSGVGGTLTCVHVLRTHSSNCWDYMNGAEITFLTYYNPADLRSA